MRRANFDAALDLVFLGAVLLVLGVYMDNFFVYFGGAVAFGVGVGMKCEN